ncbi:hypothetical protein IMZ11_35615 [Microtetraspora sp. AC03309]|uniref:hypothetical protein n=1 Tax=Microtetraspora sp. AC03309 TaxID=2779376 RepID=UPI001E4A7CAA|nr:hypothetical protein [Microtetraspora sp. AC03309]MCC5580956.1 hypothetical protein [Microtetraspora sp. AC03309]
MLARSGFHFGDGHAFGDVAEFAPLVGGMRMVYRLPDGTRYGCRSYMATVASVPFSATMSPSLSQFGPFGALR